MVFVTLFTEICPRMIKLAVPKSSKMQLTVFPAPPSFSPRNHRKPHQKLLNKMLFFNSFHQNMPYMGVCRNGIKVSFLKKTFHIASLDTQKDIKTVLSLSFQPPIYLGFSLKKASKNQRTCLVDVVSSSCIWKLKRTKMLIFKDFCLKNCNFLKNYKK